ncbi:MAG: histidine phosphatase family protein [Lachnospiraceae bacterium]|nr:histidine phosphatase family protein [Lachnospiraceae bacterium]
MKLYLLRHGETDWNKVRKIQGCTDIPLNDYGRELARKTGEGMKDIVIDLVITSSLSRARETAELVMAGRTVETIENPQIQEMDFGEYEGRPSDEEPTASILKAFFKNPGAYPPPEKGESIPELLVRTGRFLETLYQDEALRDKSILISTHGAAMTGLVNNIKGQLETNDFWKMGVPPNCAVTIVSVENGKAVIEEENHIFY